MVQIYIITIFFYLYFGWNIYTTHMPWFHFKFFGKCFNIDLISCDGYYFDRLQFNSSSAKRSLSSSFVTKDIIFSFTPSPIWDLYMPHRITLGIWSFYDLSRISPSRSLSNHHLCLTALYSQFIYVCGIISSILVSQSNLSDNFNLGGGTIHCIRRYDFISSINFLEKWLEVVRYGIPKISNYTVHTFCTILIPW